METEWLTVAEYAQKLNISQQSVYQRIKRKNSTIVKHVVKRDGKTYINAAALDEAGEPHRETSEPERKTVERRRTVEEKAVDALTKQLDELQAQLKTKDEQIAGLQKALDQQQQLQAADKQEILKLRKQLALTAAKSEPDAEEITVQSAEPENQQPKKGFLARLFGK